MMDSPFCMKAAADRFSPGIGRASSGCQKRMYPSRGKERFVGVDVCITFQVDDKVNVKKSACICIKFGQKNDISGHKFRLTKPFLTSSQ